MVFMEEPQPYGSEVQRTQHNRSGDALPWFFLLGGFGLLAGYFLLARDLNFFVPSDFTYLGGPRDLVPITDDLRRSWLRYFSPLFLGSMYWKIFLVLPASLMLGMFFLIRLKPGSVESALERIKSIRPSVCLGIICIFSLLMILVLVNFVYNGTYIVDDENAYVMQAKILEAGKITAPPPPVKKNFHNWFILTEGVYTGKYTLGFPAVLAAGHIITGSYRFMPGLLAILTALIIYGAGKELYDRHTALLSALFLGISPLFLFNSSNLLSHSASLFFLSLFMFTYLKGVKKNSLFLALVAGLCIGWAFNIRQLTAIGFGAPFAFYLFYRLKNENNRAKSLLFLALCGLGFSVFLAITFWYNHKISGGIFTFPFNVYDPTERLGFGAMLDNNRYVHTPVKSVQNLLVSMGRYNLWFLGIPCSLVFMFGLLTAKRLKWGDKWCLAVIVTYFLAYTLYYSPGIADTGPVYYYELLAPFCLLSARGLILVKRRLEEKFPKSGAGSFLALSVFICFLVSTPGFYIERMLHISALTDVLGEPYQVVEKNVRKPAIVFIRSLPRAGWVFGFRNPDPFLEGPLLYCRDLGIEKNREVVRNFPDRRYYVLYYDMEEGRSMLREWESPLE